MSVPRSYSLLDRHLLMVGGSRETGKTCLVKQFIYSHYCFDEYDPTLEDSWRKQVVIDESVYLVEILDMAGQEEYIAMRTRNIQDSEGIIIVYSVTSRQSFEEARTFYNQILHVRGEPARDSEVFPLYLVGTKADLHEERKVTIEEGIALAKEWCCEHVEASAKSRTNVDKCFEGLVREIRRQCAFNATRDSTQSRSISLPGRSLRRQTLTSSIAASPCNGVDVVNRSPPTMRLSSPAAPTSQGPRLPDSVIEVHSSQIDTCDTHERRQNLLITTVSHRRTSSGQDAVPNARGTSASRSWRFWNSRHQP